MRMGRYKLLHFFKANRVELYDLEADPGETQNLALTHPQIAEGLQGLLEESIARGRSAPARTVGRS